MYTITLVTHLPRRTLAAIGGLVQVVPTRMAEPENEVKRRAQLARSITWCMRPFCIHLRQPSRSNWSETPCPVTYTSEDPLRYKCRTSVKAGIKSFYRHNLYSVEKLIPCMTEYSSILVCCNLCRTILHNLHIYCNLYHSPRAKNDSKYQVVPSKYLSLILT